jgi:hypothetical protein
MAAPWIEPPSPFFAIADELCAHGSEVRASDADAAEHARQELLAYCADRSVAPRFAARPENERLPTLIALAQSIGLARLPSAESDAPSAIEPEPPDAPDILAGAPMTREALRLVCGALAEAPLPRTCELANRSSALTSERLRAALLADVVALARSSARRSLETSPNASGWIVLAASSAAATTHDLRSLARELGAPAEEATCAAAPCARAVGAHAEEAACAAAHCARAVRTLRVAVTLVSRVLRDRDAVLRTTDLRARVLEEIIREERGGEDARVSPGMAAEMDALVAKSRSEGVEALFHALAIAAEITGDDVDLYVSARPLALAFERAARAGDIVAVCEALIAADASLSPVTTRALRVSARLADAKTLDDAKAAAIEALVHLPPWTERWIVDVSGLVPDATGDFKLDGEASLGWNGEAWGALVRGGRITGEYTTSGDSVSLVRRTDASADVWGVVRASDALRLELRGEAGYVGYQTASTSATSSELERARMLRGAAIAGVRLAPSARVALGLWAGGGIQREAYDTLEVSDLSTNLPSVREWTARALGRVRAQWDTVPGWIAMRARADVNVFALTRRTNALTVGETVAATHEVVTAVSLDATIRVACDIEKLAIAGFRPSVVAGLNVVSVTGADGGSGVTPVFGLGVRRESF